jgi:uncharacterized protein
VIIPDVNLLLYATFTGFPEHRDAVQVLERLLNGKEEVGLTGPAVFGFLRLSTNRRVFDEALGADEAVDYVEQWQARPNVRFLVPGRRHLEVAFALVRRLGTAQNLTTDVQLAAYALENGATLYSNDTDFGRFPGLDWVNPLKGGKP